MMKFIKSLGPLRIVLLSSMILLIVSAPLAGGKTVTHGWQLITTVIFPVVVPMMFFIIPLDMTMCGILMQDKPDAVRLNYKKIIRLEFLLMILLFLAWLPFVYRLLS